MSGGIMNQGRLNRVVFAIVALFTYTAHAKQFPAVPGEYLVKLKPTSAIMSVVSLEQTLGVKIKERVSAKHGLILVQRPVIENRDASIQSLANNALVEYAEPNFIYRVVGGANALPNDPELPRLWGMINSGSAVDGDGGTFTGKMGIDINAQKAWEIETGNKDVIVAVIDTGVDWSNTDLAPNIYTNEVEKNGTAGVDDDNNGCIDDLHGCDIVMNDGDPMDVYGHGTHVSGTIGAAGNNNMGVVGVAWNVTILPIRFLGDDGSGNLADAVKAIDYAIAMKANIMNNSWGGGGFSQGLLEAIERARDAGILFVAAAGNSANDNDASPEYPAAYQVDNIIAVAAVDPTGMMADFSNYGKNSVQIAAPGVNVLSYTMRGLESWSGTSMACPHVAGVATLLLSQDMTQSYMTLKQRLLSSARPLGGLRGRVGTGLVNAYWALSNQVAPEDPDDPFNWQKTTDTVSTDHPYVNNDAKEWTLKVDGAKRVAVYFSRVETEAGYDKITFKNANGDVIGSISGKLGETYSPVVEGDTVIISFTSDDTVNSYGFDVGGIAYQ
jgi:thermitase